MDEDRLIGTARPIAFARGRSFGMSDEDCEDLLQEALIKYLRAWPDGAAPDNAAAWFETAIGRLIIDGHRRAKARHQVQAPTLSDDPVDEFLGTVRSDRAASLPAISAALQAQVFGLMPAPQAELIRRRYVDNEAGAKLAGELGITVAALDQRCSQAKRKLRDALAGRPDLVEELRNPHPHLYR